MLWSVSSMFEWTRLHDICLDICMDRWSIGAVISIQYCILAISGQPGVKNNSVAQGNTVIISSSYAIMQPSAPWSVVFTTKKNIHEWLVLNRPDDIDGYWIDIYCSIERGAKNGPLFDEVYYVDC